jgi:hypothetical protein
MGARAIAKSIVTGIRVTDVKIHRRPQGSYMVTIPLGIVNNLNLKEKRPGSLC